MKDSSTDLKRSVYNCLKKADLTDYWDKRNGYYNTTLAGEDVIEYLGGDVDEDEVFEIVSDWFESKGLKTV
jgi:predicted TPR repeat methyltransferase